MTENLLEPLKAHAAASPQRVALRSSGRPDSSFSDLIAFVDQAIADLQSNGVTPQARIATILPNAPETALAILAVSSYATSIPLNPAYAPEEMKLLLRDAGVTHVITDMQKMPHAVSAGRDLGLATLHLSSILAAPTGAFKLTEDRVPPISTDSQSARRTALVLHTSGSTGTPKRVPLTPANLISSAWNVAKSLELGPGDICLNMMPMFHIGALVDLLLAPLYAGGAVAFTPEISTSAFFASLRKFQPTWFQAVPTVLRDILAHKAAGDDVEAVGQLRFIRAVSQPLPLRLQDEFEQTFGTTLVPIFGMTETAGLIASVPLDRSRRKSGSVGISVGCSVKICDSFGNEVAPMRRGEVLISGPNVMNGYEGTETSHAETFRGSWLRSGDEGYLDEDGCLFLTGRLKDIINRGGEKISPLEIDQILADHPAIREAAAFPLPHPTLGEEVAVAVVPATDTMLEPRDVTDHLRSRLAPFKVPRTVVFLDRLPRVPSGKLDRLALPGLASGAASSTSVRTLPETPLAKSLASMWRKVLKVPDVAMEDDFFDLGGDSLTAMNFASLLEEKFGRDLPLTLLFDAPTLREMEQALSRAIERSASNETLDPRIRTAVRKVTAAWRGKRKSMESLIVGRNTMGTKRPFFWVSQTLHGFEALAACFDPERPLYAMTSLSATGMKSDENTRRLAAHYAEEILEIEPDRPVLLGGFCQGGVVAFEIAKALRCKGHEVALLCLQDRFIPEPYDGEVALFWGKREDVCAYYGNDRPERGWMKYYSGPLSVFYCDADHQEVHNPPYVGIFAHQLENEFTRVETKGAPQHPCGFEPLRPVDPRSFRSRIRAAVPLFLRQGSEHSIRVRVTNTSPVAWEPTESSGIILAARWQNLDKRYSRMLDGRLPLRQEVRPGEVAEFDLPIRVPMRSLPMLLHIDLVEDGISWFGSIGRSGTRKLVIPLRPA